MIKKVAQYINRSGKQNAVKFESNIWLITELSSPELLPEEEISPSELRKVISFCKNNELEINATVLEGDLIQGLWVQGQELYGYIPLIPEVIKENDFLMSIKQERDNPYFQPSKSVLRHVHLEEKVAETLKSITLDLFGEILRNETVNPVDVLSRKIKVDRSRFYNPELLELEGIKFQDEAFMYVPSEETKSRLLRFVEATFYSSPNKVLIPSAGFHFYQSVEDFKKRPDQLIFLSQDALKAFMIEKKEERNVVHTNFTKVFERTEDPFVYCNPRFNNGRPVIVQKVNGDSKERCVNLSKKWISSNTNEGFDYVPMNEKFPESDVLVYDIRGRILQGNPQKLGKKIRLLLFAENKFASMFYL